MELEKKLFNYLKQIKYTRLSITNISADIASQIIELGILREKSRDDAVKKFIGDAPRDKVLA